MKKIIYRIKKFMEDLDISEKDLYNGIGMGQRTVNYYLKGERAPSLEFIEKIASTYPDLNSDWLLIGEGAMLKTGDRSIVASVDGNTIGGDVKIGNVKKTKKSITNNVDLPSKGHYKIIKPDGTVEIQSEELFAESDKRIMELENKVREYENTIKAKEEVIALKDEIISLLKK